jgi:hypothetical protein
LVVDPSKRLGGGMQDSEEVKSHKYFLEINWNDVYNRKLYPPVPIIGDFNSLHPFKMPVNFEDNVYDDSLGEQGFNRKIDGCSFINEK